MTLWTSTVIGGVLCALASTIFGCGLAKKKRSGDTDTRSKTDSGDASSSSSTGATSSLGKPAKKKFLNNPAFRPAPRPILPETTLAGLATFLEHKPMPGPKTTIANQQPQAVTVVSKTAGVVKAATEKRFVAARSGGTGSRPASATPSR